MLGIDERALRITWTIFLFLASLAIIAVIRQTLLVFAVAIFFAYMLAPLVSAVLRIIPRQRGIALAIVYVLFVGILVGLGFAIVPAIGDQASSLFSRLPSLLNSDRLLHIRLPDFLEPMQEQIVAAVKREASHLEASAVPFLQQAGSRLLSGMGLVLPVILIPILAFFFLKDANTITHAVAQPFHNPKARITFEKILLDMHNVLKNYIRALVILSSISFVVWALFLKLIGIEYELLLAGLAGVLEFIPVVGPVVALGVILVVATATGSGGYVWVIIFWGVYRLFQDYVLNPYLMKAGLELHPLLVLFGVLAGEQLGGIAGMFFSVPVLAMIKVIYSNLKVHSEISSENTAHEISAL